MPVLRRLLPVVAAAMMLAACSSSEPPQVTFAAGTASVVARPTQYCDESGADCTGDPAAPVALAVPAGTALQVTVPDVIAQTPWQVVFSYRDANGAQADERSPVFAPTERSIWTLELAAPTDRLLTAQVQQYGPPPQINPDTGEVEFPIRASWVLNTSGG
ncbi:hypothetical protein GCM10009609_58940 [Pseudonocardia aurantiaca]|uniref:DUF2771 family protein n=1 Tax=Pseudonocardia aurantiaca TaxID=75290 RepID=A0ABW4FWK1_9PSEU